MEGECSRICYSSVRPSVRQAPRHFGPALQGFSKDVRRICHPNAVDGILISGPVYQEAFYHPDWGGGGEEREDEAEVEK